MDEHLFFGLNYVDESYLLKSKYGICNEHYFKLVELPTQGEEVLKLNVAIKIRQDALANKGSEVEGGD